MTELALLVEAWEKSQAGTEETEAVLTHCESLLTPGSTVSPEVLQALANIARSEPGRKRISDSSLVQRIGSGVWSCGDHQTALQVSRMSVLGFSQS